MAITTYDFERSKKAGEHILYHAEFTSSVGDLEIDVLTIAAQTLDGDDVTAELIDYEYTNHQDNVAQFMAMQGDAGEQYLIIITATMTDGQIEIVRGLLTVT